MNTMKCLDLLIIKNITIQSNDLAFFLCSVAGLQLLVYVGPVAFQDETYLNFTTPPEIGLRRSLVTTLNS